jgi:membrane-bound lytic murein transglycosylase D|tara:strand:+ start:752 stop:2056 length:1305 start_codon:yes stop_codon:yes gene_type:complete
MKKNILGFFVLLFYTHFYAVAETDEQSDSLVNVQSINQNAADSILFSKRLNILNEQTPFDLVYNKYVENSIKSYLGRDKKLVSRMLGIAPIYFPMFEEYLDKYDIPLEFKYLAIVESALNPKARSRSGARGLWQFMYKTGKQYNLDVTSYCDERLDPIKSTESACQYFSKLYEMFGDWSLVLAAYNGGPGYLTRTMAKTGLYDYWELRPYLRRETRGYVPAFIAVNYVMNYYNKHSIEVINIEAQITETDTVKLKMQVDFETLEQAICVDEEIIEKLNPSITKNIFPKNTTIKLPTYSIIDFVCNEESIYKFVSAVDQKEILINETRLLYTVKEGDYLGKIAQSNNIPVNFIREWNKMKDDNLSIGQQLVLFVKDSSINEKDIIDNPVYIVKEGDTLWDIAKKYKGISVNELIKHNNLNSNQLKPGEKIILPTG